MCQVRTSRVLWLAVALGVMTHAGTAWSADAAVDEYNFAVGLYKMNRWSQAADAFKEYLADHPQDAKVPYGRLYLGFSQVQLGKYQEAREELRGFVRGYPNSRNLSDAMYRVAECSYFLDDLEAAESEFLAFLQKAPDDSLAEWGLPYLGDVQLRRNNPRAAVATFEKSLTQFPKGRLTEEVKFGLAQAHEALKEYPKATELYRQLAANRSGTRAPQAQLKLAARYFDAAEYAQSAAAYVELEQHFPESQFIPSARLNAGYAYHELGDNEKALTQFELAGQDETQRVTANYWKGLSLKARADYPQAADVLKTTYESHPNDSLAESILFQWADCELRNGRFDVAGPLFEQVVERWPKSEDADDSLHLAAECRLQQAARSTQPGHIAARLAEVKTLIDRFAAEYPDSGLQLSHRLVRGRLLDAEGRLMELQGQPEPAKSKFTAAQQDFEEVLKRSQLERTRSQARFQLARVCEKLGDHARAVETIRPLAEQVQREGAETEFAEALALYGTSLLAEKQYEQASSAMGEYLTLRPDGAQVEQALAAAALAEAHLKHKAPVETHLAALRERFAGRPTVVETTYQIAEIAYSEKDWDWSTGLFRFVLDAGEATPYHAASLSGLAWCQFQRGDFKEAAATFARVVAEHSDDELAPEAAYKRGDALQQAGEFPDAAAAFSAALQQYAPSHYAYLSGLQTARILRKQAKTAEADAAYAELLKAFPKPDNLDKVLDEWALLRYEAKDFKQADELFRRLVEEVPDSELADNARYSLAESDLAAGRLEDARKVFDDLSKSDKSDPTVKEDSLFRLAGIGSERENWQGVQTAAQQLQTQFPESGHRWEVRFLNSDAQLHLGDLEAAKATLLSLKTEKDNPTIAQAEWFPHVWIRLAEVVFRLKEYDQVAATVDELRSWAPECPVLYLAHEVLGRGYKTQAKFDLAREAFRRVTQSGHGARTATAAKSQLLIAETYFLQQDYEKAWFEYMKVHTLYQYPEWQAPALFQAALCDEQLNRWEDAVKTYENLLQAFPDSEFAGKARTRLKTARKKAAA